jgi:hypothetical protein
MVSIASTTTATVLAEPKRRNIEAVNITSLHVENHARFQLRTPERMA